MKTEVINTVLGRMGEVLQVEQLAKLKEVMVLALENKEVVEEKTKIIIREGDDLNERYLQKFAIEKKVEGLAETTIRQYLTETRKFLYSTGKVFHEITKDDALLYLAKLSAAGLSSNTVDNSRKYIKSFFTWLAWNDYIAKSPFERLRCTKREEVKKVILTEKEVEEMRDACSSVRDLAVFEFMLSTGLRVSELINLKIEDVDFDSGKVQIYSIKTKTHRVGYLDARALKHLSDYREMLRKQGVQNNSLFLNSRKTKDKYHQMSKNAVERLLHELTARAGVNKEVTVHTIRKTFASKLYKKGVKPMTIQYLLGHAEFSTTSKYYINLDDSDVKYEFYKAVA